MVANQECWSVDEENYNYDSLAELLASHGHLVAGDKVYVGTAVPPVVSQLCDADDVLETIADRASDFAGEYGADCAEVDKEAKAELNALLAAWIEKHCNLNFWQVSDVRPHVLTEEDRPGGCGISHPVGVLMFCRESSYYNGSALYRHRVRGGRRAYAFVGPADAAEYAAKNNLAVVHQVGAA